MKQIIQRSVTATHSQQVSDTSRNKIISITMEKEAGKQMQETKQKTN